MSCAGGLSGLRVLVTRPAAQAQRLCEMIAAAGGEPVRFPVMAIEPVKATIPDLTGLDWLVFISANAVTAFFEQLAQPLPAVLKVAAIGNKTAAVLERHGVTPTLVPPSRFTSEALLQLPEWQSLPDQQVLIVRGVGGRETLRNELQQRGARVDYCEVYRRALPAVDTVRLLAEWRERGIGLVTVSSNEGLHNLTQLLGPQGTLLLQQTPIIAISPRVADTITERGLLLASVQADNATDEAVMSAVSRWAEQQNVK